MNRARAGTKGGAPLSRGGVLEIVVVVATVGIASVLAGVARARRRAAVRVLEAYARARALRFEAAPARVEGVRGAVPFVVDHVRLDGRVCTRVTARAPRGRALRLRLVPRGVTGGRLSPPRALDQLWALRSRPADAALAESTLERAHDELRLLRSREAVWIASDGQRVVCAWAGTEEDVHVLDAACRTVTCLAGTHVPDAPYR